MAAAPTANSVKRSISLSFFFSIQRVGSQPFTSPAMRTRNCRAVEQRDGADAALAGEERAPGLARADADGGDEADAGDDDAFHVGVTQLGSRRSAGEPLRRYFLACFSM